MHLENFQKMLFADTENDQLFKLAAKQLVKKFPEVSFKYEVLCYNTAFLGVVKKRGPKNTNEVY